MLIKTLCSSLALGALLLTSGCFQAENSADVNQDRIFTDFDLHYDGQAGVTVARAAFKFGNALGTQLILSDNSDIRFNGQALSEVILPVTNLTYYEKTFPNAVSSGTFLFVDESGTSYSNTAAIRPIDFPAQVGPISKSSSYELVWAGNPLAADEEVSVVLYRIAETQLAVFYQKQAGATSIILDKGGLKNIVTGEITLILERKATNNKPTEAPAAEGVIKSRYTPAHAKVLLAE